MILLKAVAPELYKFQVNRVNTHIHKPAKAHKHTPLTIIEIFV